MGEATNDSTLETAMLELDPDGSGAVSKAEFESWYHDDRNLVWVHIRNFCR